MILFYITEYMGLFYIIDYMSLYYIRYNSGLFYIRDYMGLSTFVTTSDFSTSEISKTALH